MERNTLSVVHAFLRARVQPGGVMALALYYGGANGYEERDALPEYLRGVDECRYSVLCCDWRNRPNDPPIAVFIWREK